jgi:hypothetical protein
MNEEAQQRQREDWTQAKREKQGKVSKGYGSYKLPTARIASFD